MLSRALKISDRILKELAEQPSKGYITFKKVANPDGTTSELYDVSFGDYSMLTYIFVFRSTIPFLLLNFLCPARRFLSKSFLHSVMQLTISIHKLILKKFNNDRYNWKMKRSRNWKMLKRITKNA